MKHLLSVLCVLSVLSAAPAAIVYSGLQNIAIPTDVDGVFIDIDGTSPMTAFSDFSGADINPFFGGMGIANNPAFQPARTSTSNLAAIVRFNAGDLINGSLNYSTGYGGSGDPNDHIGVAANQFLEGTTGFMGFRFTTNSSAGPYYGWMRVQLTSNTAGGKVIDWAYDDSGAAILAGFGVVPEPSRAMLLMLGMGVAMTHRRRLVRAS
jgi:hypothetical protein